MKQLVKQVAARFGFDVQRHNPLGSEYGRLTRLLAAHRADLVLDIGANAGQWVREMRRAGYSGDVISFEPLSAAYRELEQHAANDAHWKVAPRMALGDQIAGIEINIAANSFSSSLLPMLSAHLESAPESAYVGKEAVPMQTLDSLAGSLIPDSSRRIFCKLDVQGYEAKVLAGAAAIMDRIIGLQMELSLVPVYEGAPDFADVLQNMAHRGFSIHGFVPGFIDAATGRMLQIDGVFFR